jgi:DNA-binding transcriptional ArsR family regulator
VTGPDVQREARALGDPTRHRLFRYIVDAARPVGVGELTDYEQLNHNAVRQHLAVL